MTGPDLYEPSTEDERAAFHATEDIIRAGLIFRGDHALSTRMTADIMERLKEMGWQGPIRS